MLHRLIEASAEDIALAHEVETRGVGPPLQHGRIHISQEYNYYIAHRCLLGSQTDVSFVCDEQSAAGYRVPGRFLVKPDPILPLSLVLRRRGWSLARVRAGTIKPLAEDVVRAEPLVPS